MTVKAALSASHPKGYQGYFSRRSWGKLEQFLRDNPTLEEALLQAFVTDVVLDARHNYSVVLLVTDSQIVLWSPINAIQYIEVAHIFDVSARESFAGGTRVQLQYGIDRGFYDDILLNRPDDGPHKGLGAKLLNAVKQLNLRLSVRICTVDMNVPDDNGCRIGNAFVGIIRESGALLATQ